MAVGRMYERIVYRPRYSLGLVDSLARALKTAGSFPVPIGEVRVVLLGRDFPLPAQDFTPPLELASIKNASGYALLSGDVIVPGTDQPLWPIQAGTYRARIIAEFYRDLDVQLVWPPANIGAALNYDLLPAANYPFPELSANRNGRGLTLIRGTLRQPGGAPVVGATVSITPALQFQHPPWPFASGLTSDTGDWALLIPEQSELTQPMVPPVTLRIAYSATTSIDVPGVPLAIGRENAVRNTVLRGRVVDGAGRPITKATVKPSLETGQAVTDAGGNWSYYFDLRLTDAQSGGVTDITVTTPSGTSATFANIAVLQGKTLSVPQFTIP